MMPHTDKLDLTLQGDLVLPDGSVLQAHWLGIREGRIVMLSAEPLHAVSHVDARGMLVLPGFVDAHVHTRSSVDEGITATTRAAAAGGTTTVIDMPFDRPARPVRDPHSLQEKIEDIGVEALVDVGLYGTFAPEGPLDELAEMVARGVCGFKVSTIEVDPLRFPRITDGRLYEAFQEIAHLGVPVAAHQENEDIINRVEAHHRALGQVHGVNHARSRPPVAEAEAAGRLLELAYWTGAHLHMVHGTIPRTFDLINWNRSKGVVATGETCIQYLLLTEAALDQMGGRAKCNPPLRKEADVEQLWEQLANSQIDIVTSDHSPYPLSKKSNDTIFEDYAGMPGAETLGTLLYSEGVAQGRISLRRFVEVLASGPASLFGFSRKGRIQPGYDADLVIFDPDMAWEIDEQALHYNDGWSPYHGFPVQGKVQATYVRGTCVYQDGHVRAAPGTGRFVKPDAVVNSLNTTGK